MAAANPDVQIEKEAAALDAKSAGKMLGGYVQGPVALAQMPSCAPPRTGRIAKRYIETLFDEFTPLAGDRGFAEDEAIIGGLARLNDRPVMVIGAGKGA